MKKIAALLLVLVGPMLSAQSALFERYVSLNSDDEFELPSAKTLIQKTEFPEFVELLGQEKAIADAEVESLCSNPVLKVMGINTVSSNLQTSFEYVVDRSYLYTDYVTSLDNDSRSFLRRIAKSEKIRSILSDSITNILCGLCKIYPRDFKSKILADLISIDKMLKNDLEEYDLRHYYNSSYKTLLHNSEEDYATPYTWKGFVLRRVLIDGIPAEEISGYITNCISRLSEVDNKNNPQLLSKITINDEVVLYSSASEEYYIIKDLKFPKPAWTDTIKCAKDGKLSFYMFNEKLLIDNTGEVLFNEE